MGIVIGHGVWICAFAFPWVAVIDKFAAAIEALVNVAIVHIENLDTKHQLVATVNGLSFFIAASGTGNNMVTIVSTINISNYLSIFTLRHFAISGFYIRIQIFTHHTFVAAAVSIAKHGEEFVVGGRRIAQINAYHIVKRQTVTIDCR